MKRIIILIAIIAAGCGEGPEPGEPNHADSAGMAKPGPVQHAAVAPEALEASLDAAEQYLQTRDVAKAEAILLRLLDRAPREPGALEMHGRLLIAKAADARDRGDHAQATEHFSKAYERYASLVELQPHSAGLQQSAGEVAQVAGRVDDALRHYQRARQLNPADPKPHFFAAQIFIERGEYEAAVSALSEVLAIDPDEPLAHASLANVAIEQQRFADALNHIAEAREIQPGDASYRVIEATIHRKRGQPQVAVELLVALPPQQRSSWFVAEELAAGYTELQKHTLAAEVWEHFHNLNRRDPRAFLAAVRAGQSLLKAGQREDARRWLNVARLDAPDAMETQALAEAFLTSP